MVAFPREIEPPLLMFSVLPLSLFVFKLAKLLHLYRIACRREPAPDGVRGAGRTEPVAHDRLCDAERARQSRPAVLPHAEACGATRLAAGPRRGSRGSVPDVRALVRGVRGVSRIPEVDGDLTGLVGSPDLTVWVAVLLVQSIPYAAAVVLSIVSCLRAARHLDR